MIEALEKYWNSPEGKQEIIDQATQRKKQEKILNSQFERFHKKFSKDFSRVVDLVVKKYNSGEYINRWYSRGIIPPENLLWFLFEYAEKYGREAKKKEYKKIDDMFTSVIYKVHKYFFERIDSQGSAILVHQQKNNEIIRL